MRSRPRAHLAAMAAAMAATTLLLLAGPVLNDTSVALAYVMLVLTVAAIAQSGPAVTAALASAVAYNYFFLQPVGTFTIADPRNWVALMAMLSVGVAVGELSRRARRRAADAEASRADAESLLRRLQASFERETETEALRRSERLKSALLDGVTHDLRTPLTSIKASVTALLDDETTRGLDAGARHELLVVVNEEADRLNHLVEQLVSMARIEATQLALARAWSSLDEIVSAAVARARPRLHGQALRVEVPPELPAIRVDARAIEEAVYLLLENAVKYTPSRGTITLGVTVGREQVAVVVDDDGPGIPPEERERVFAPFTRGVAGSGTEGMGMGLAIVRGLVEAHGGTVALETRPDGHGARFAIRLPIGDEGEA